MPLAECEQRLDAARAKLLAAREKRVRPGRDEKVLTSWNALMMRGMARAARVFGRPEWLASARRAMDFIRGTLWHGGRLLATYKDGHAHLNAYLDDYAFLLDALLELMQADFRDADLEFARALADVLLEQFEDRAAGGFFFVSPRPRAAHPPRQARPRQRHALRQRHRRVRSAAAGASHRRAALPGGRRARAETLLPRHRAPAGRLRQPRHRARRVPCAAADRHPARRPGATLPAGSACSAHLPTRHAR